MDDEKRLEESLAYSMGWMHALTETVLSGLDIPNYRIDRDAERIQQTGIDRYHLLWHGTPSESTRDSWQRGWWQGWAVGSRAHSERVMAIASADQARNEVRHIVEAWALYREYGVLWQPEADKRPRKHTPKPANSQG